MNLALVLSQICREYGITLVAYSPLCQGLLTGWWLQERRVRIRPLCSLLWDGVPLNTCGIGERIHSAHSAQVCFPLLPSPPPCCTLVLPPGKYVVNGEKPFGPRKFLFTDSRIRDIQPLLSVMKAIADERGKTLAQVGCCLLSGTRLGAEARQGRAGGADFLATQLSSRGLCRAVPAGTREV